MVARIKTRPVENLASEFRDLDPLLQRVYSSRINSPDDLRLGLENLLRFDHLKGMPDAVQLLETALLQQKRVLIVADYDADGATSCALAINAFHAMGFQHLDYIVPNRFEYGYGLTPAIVELAAHRSPDLLITVDNGISSIDGVAAAASLGIETLVTDHHLAGDSLPQAAAIVNPNQPGCEFPSKALAGVGVIFYVVAALRARLREQGYFQASGIAEPRLSEYLDLVALGTVADVVPLDRNNRILVDEGLKRIRAGLARPGISALLQVAKRTAGTLAAADLGFSIGPRLNAAGRLDDMSTGIECLLSEDLGTAYDLARELDGMNEERKIIEQKMKDEAFSLLDEMDMPSGAVPPALCLHDAGWHQGVIGILASRVKERLNRPVIAFAPAGEVTGELSDEALARMEWKGSARSIPGFHIRDALDTVAARNPGLIVKFGGHAMAAGLSLPGDRLQEFQQQFEQVAGEVLDESALAGELLTDGELPGEWLNLEHARLLRSGGPWGQGFEEPLFHGRFEVLEHRVLKGRHLKLKLVPAGQETPPLDAIAFNLQPEEMPTIEGAQLLLSYRLDVNDFRDTQSAQLIVDRFLPDDIAVNASA